MKAFMIGPNLCLLTEEGTWACSEDRLRQELEEQTSRLLKEFSPANGIWREYLFTSMAVKFLADGVINDEVPETSDEEVEGLVY